MNPIGRTLRIRHFTRFKFTKPELELLAGYALHNELASDILVRYNKLYGKRG